LALLLRNTRKSAIALRSDTLLLLYNLVDEGADTMRDENAELVAVLESDARLRGPSDAGGGSVRSEERECKGLADQKSGGLAQ
jgi:hypothetical protein